MKLFLLVVFIVTVFTAIGNVFLGKYDVATYLVGVAIITRIDLLYYQLRGDR